MKDTKSLLLLLLCIGLTGTWVYHIYDKTIYSRQKILVFKKDSAAVAAAVRDSLDIIYTAAITDLDNRLNYSKVSGDSLRNTLDSRLHDIARLKAEIRKILNKQGLSGADLAYARQKISELRKQVDGLIYQKKSMEMEQRQLAGQMEQLIQQTDTLQKSILQLSGENKLLNEKIAASSVFVAYDLTLEAMAVKRVKEEPTTRAGKTDKFVASFVVQNHASHISNAEIIVILIRPNGTVMQSAVWGSGSFASSDGDKDYTRKIRFDYEKGEQKNLLFSIDSGQCQQGTYILQLWYGGHKIAQVNKTLH